MKIFFFTTVFAPSVHGVERHLARCSARSVAERYLEIFRRHTGAT